jgi:hypothetical protein
VLPPIAQSFVAALAAAGVKFRVSHGQPDGMTPIFVEPGLREIRRQIPPGAEIAGEVVRFPEEWVVAFCRSDVAR